MLSYLGADIWQGKGLDGLKVQYTQADQSTAGQHRHPRGDTTLKETHIYRVGGSYRQPPNWRDHTITDFLTLSLMTHRKTGWVSTVVMISVRDAAKETLISHPPDAKRGRGEVVEPED